MKYFGARWHQAIYLQQSWQNSIVTYGIITDQSVGMSLENEWWYTKQTKCHPLHQLSQHVLYSI